MFNAARDVDTEAPQINDTADRSLSGGLQRASSSDRAAGEVPALVIDSKSSRQIINHNYTCNFN